MKQKVKHKTKSLFKNKYFTNSPTISCRVTIVKPFHVSVTNKSYTKGTNSYPEPKAITIMLVFLTFFLVSSLVDVQIVEIPFLLILIPLANSSGCFKFRSNKKEQIIIHNCHWLFIHLFGGGCYQNTS